MQALPIWETVPLLIVILGVLVLVHEFGHFITAKWFGVEAPEFGIGFPPRVLTLGRTEGWIEIQGRRIRIPRNFKLPPELKTGDYVKYETDHQSGRETLTRLEVVDPAEAGATLASPVQILDRGTVFTINAIPFGGFVRMTGEDDPSAPNSLAAKPAWQRAIILVAGVTMNFVLAFVAFSILAAWIPEPVQVLTTQIQRILPDTPAAQSDLRAGDTIVSVNGVDVKNDREAMLSQLVANCGQPVTLGVDRPDVRGVIQRVSVQLTPHPSGNVACAVGVLINAEAGVKIRDVAPGSLGDQIGLRHGDGLIRVGSFDMVGPGNSLTLSTRDEKDLAAYIEENSKVPTVVQVVAVRDGQILPDLPLSIPAGIPSDQANLGLSFHLNAIGAMGSSLSQMYQAVLTVPQALTGIFSSFGKGGDSGVAGPIRIGQIIAVGTPTGGLPFLVDVVGFLSLNLAVLNLLPFPGLDGGRLAFVIVEMLRGGRKLDPRKEGIIHLIGLMVLVAFILFVSYSDVARLLSGKSPFSP